MATVKDEKGRFVKTTEVAETDDKDEEIARLKAEVEALSTPPVAEEVGPSVPVGTEPKPEEPTKKPTLRLQSKYREHRVMIRPTRRVIHAALGTIEMIPGLAVRFEGPQRIFDSEYSQTKYGWSDEERDLVERKLVSMNEFMSDFYPAPMSVLPEHLAAVARVRPPVARIKCQAFGFVDGQLKQCSIDAAAGRQWCADHDPDQTRITRGMATTTG